MQSQIRSIALLFCLFIAIPAQAGVFDSLFGNDSLDDSELKNALSLQLPSYLSVDSFAVNASQNYGTDVEPVWVARFESSIKIKTDLYIDDSKEGEITFLRLKTPQGSLDKIYGKITSTLYQEKWRHKISYDGNPVPNFGQPKNSYAGRAIVRGSTEESNYYTEISKKQEQRIEERKKIFLSSLTANLMLLIGKWQDTDGDVRTFKDDGTWVMTKKRGNVVSGSWKNNNGLLRMNWGYGITEDKVILIDQEKCRFQRVTGGNIEWTAVRVQ